MALDWVQRAIESCLGFLPFPGTLNLRMEAQELEAWRALRKSLPPVELPSADPSFCRAHCFRAHLEALPRGRVRAEPVAVLVPEVAGYPPEKLEVIAAAPLKETYGLCDGDKLTLRFEA